MIEDLVLLLGVLFGFAILAARIYVEWSDAEFDRKVAREKMEFEAWTARTEAE